MNRTDSTMLRAFNFTQTTSGGSESSKARIPTSSEFIYSIQNKMDTVFTFWQNSPSEVKTETLFSSSYKQALAKVSRLGRQLSLIIVDDNAIELKDRRYIKSLQRHISVSLVSLEGYINSLSIQHHHLDQNKLKNSSQWSNPSNAITFGAQNSGGNSVIVTYANDGSSERSSNIIQDTKSDRFSFPSGVFTPFFELFEGNKKILELENKPINFIYLINIIQRKLQESDISLNFDLNEMLQDKRMKQLSFLPTYFNKYEINYILKKYIGKGKLDLDLGGYSAPRSTLDFRVGNMTEKKIVQDIFSFLQQSKERDIMQSIEEKDDSIKNNPYLKPLSIVASNDQSFSSIEEESHDLRESNYSAKKYSNKQFFVGSSSSFYRQNTDSHMNWSNVKKSPKSGGSRNTIISANNDIKEPQSAWIKSLKRYLALDPKIKQQMWLVEGYTPISLGFLKMHWEDTDNYHIEIKQSMKRHLNKRLNHPDKIKTLRKFNNKCQQFVESKLECILPGFEIKELLSREESQPIVDHFSKTGELTSLLIELNRLAKTLIEKNLIRKKSESSGETVGINKGNTKIRETTWTMSKIDVINNNSKEEYRKWSTPTVGENNQTGESKQPRRLLSADLIKKRKNQTRGQKKGSVIHLMYKKSNISWEDEESYFMDGEEYFALNSLRSHGVEIPSGTLEDEILDLFYDNFYENVKKMLNEIFEASREYYLNVWVSEYELLCFVQLFEIANIFVLEKILEYRTSKDILIFNNDFLKSVVKIRSERDSKNIDSDEFLTISQITHNVILADLSIRFPDDSIREFYKNLLDNTNKAFLAIYEVWSLKKDDVELEESLSLIAIKFNYVAIDSVTATESKRSLSNKSKSTQKKTVTASYPNTLSLAEEM